MKLRIVATVLCTGLVILVGCNGETGMSVNLSTDLNPSPVTERHSSGRIKASGHVIPGTTQRVGRWTAWYDDESGAKQWEGYYVNGMIDQGRPWREWNPDGSIRSDSTDL